MKSYKPNVLFFGALAVNIKFWKKVSLTVHLNKKIFIEIYLSMSRKFTFSQKCLLFQRCCTCIFTTRNQYIRTNMVLLLMCQEQPQEVLNSREKTCVLESLFNKVEGLLDSNTVAFL